MHEPITSEKLKWIAVDLDDTLAHNSGNPDFILHEPTEGAREFMQKIIDDGFKPIIYTARGWSEYDVIETWLIKHEIPFRRIICGKPLFYRIIDDKNISFKGNWDDVYKQL